MRACDRATASRRLLEVHPARPAPGQRQHPVVRRPLLAVRRPLETVCRDACYTNSAVKEIVSLNNEQMSMHSCRSVSALSRRRLSQARSLVARCRAAAGGWSRWMWTGCPCRARRQLRGHIKTPQRNRVPLPGLRRPNWVGAPAAPCDHIMIWGSLRGRRCKRSTSDQVAHTHASRAHARARLGVWANGQMCLGDGLRT